MVEEVREPEGPPSVASARSGYGAAAGGEPIRLGDIEMLAEERVKSDIAELDMVLGGGFVPGGIVMLGGDPGIGKSTLSLQVAGHFASKGLEVLYISGEESLTQIRLRANRLGVDSKALWVVGETSVERVEKLLSEKRPALAVIDSIQTLQSESLTSAPGSVAQLREVTSRLTQIGKGFSIPIVLVGHVTKEGAIAGPKVLEHMVDTVLYFESQNAGAFRLLRAVKNRFGSTNEVGIFEMRGDGLHEVGNPSAAFLEGRPTDAPGSVVVPILEGTRPLMVEVQALVSPTNYGPPRVTAVGVDTNRVILLLNILEKRTGAKVAGMDVFINVAGGLKLMEPAADLAIAMAILSSFYERAVPSDLAIFGELGLTGEVRAVAQAARRVAETRKLGFKRVLGPKANIQEVKDELKESALLGAQHVAEARRLLFGDR